MSKGETMSSDDGNDLAGPNPFVGSFGGIIIIDSAARGVRTIDGLPGCFIGGIRHWGVNSPVVETGESSWLVDNAGKGIGKDLLIKVK